MPAQRTDGPFRYIEDTLMETAKAHVLAGMAVVHGHEAWVVAQTLIARRRNA